MAAKQLDILQSRLMQYEDALLAKPADQNAKEMVEHYREETKIQRRAVLEMMRTDKADDGATEAPQL